MCVATRRYKKSRRYERSRNLGLAEALVAELKAAGAAVLCWTVRSPEAEAEARRIADNITFEDYAAAIPAPMPAD